MNAAVDVIGSYGPSIVYIYANVLYLYLKNFELLYMYNFGFFIGIILNLVLKGIIKQPRPSQDINEFNSDLMNGRRFSIRNGMMHDIYGMPSGHTTITVYTLLFIFFTVSSKHYFYILLSIVAITMYQRVAYMHHTSMQVFVGFIVGSLYAILVNVLYKKKYLKIMGNL